MLQSTLYTPELRRETTLIIQILKHTPTWVFGLLLVLVYLGYVQSKTRLVPMQRLSILPAAMLCLSLTGVWSVFGLSLVGFGTWASTIIAIVLVSRSLKQPHGVVYASDTRVFTVPGSWVPFVLMMVIFFTRYVVAVALARNPAFRSSVSFVAVASMAYGFGSGMFLARALRIASAATQRESNVGYQGISG